MRVQECDKHKTCNACWNSRDPFCGWCSLYNKCSLRSKCTGAGNTPQAWINYKAGGGYPNITSFTPRHIQRSTEGKLNLVIEHLSQFPKGFQYQCLFDFSGEPYNTEIDLKTDSVSCNTPPIDFIPPIPEGHHNITAQLSVQSINGPKYLTTKIMFYDCSTYSSCTQCMSSDFPCGWCVDKPLCTENKPETCSIFFSNQNGQEGHCPTINTPNQKSQEILVPFNSTKAVDVIHQTENKELFNNISKSTFNCEFDIEGNKKSVKATLLDENHISCDSMPFIYKTNLPNTKTPLSVIWNSSHQLDNPTNVHINIYKCNELAKNCSSCVKLEEKYRCVWCTQTHTCEVLEQCDNRLKSNQTCPDSKITSFLPKSGPYEGGTNVTIKGNIFEKSFNNINVTIAGRTCHCQPVKDWYENSTEFEIVCQVSGTGGSKNGPVIVDTINSKEDYEFVKPFIKNISPLRGIRSGGTILNITGSHLNAGSLFEAFIDDLPCHILSRESALVQCITSPSHKVRDGKFEIKIDKAKLYFGNGTFKYLEHPLPIIDSIVYNKQSSKYLKETPAGGTRINLVGKNFHYYKNSMISVNYKERTFENECHVTNDTHMNCTAPSIPYTEFTPEDEDPEKLSCVFEMDNITTDNNPFDYWLYPNPIYENFSNGEMIYFEGDHLIINGQHLDLVSQESDIIVKIGKESCNITSMFKNQLTCQPPAKQPSNQNTNITDKADVTVRVGNEMTFYLGKLRYCPSPLLLEIWFAGTSIIIIIVICLVLCVAYCRKSSENNRILKENQEQMDNLELKVASECKQAFVELQTEIRDTTSDLTSGGFPFLDYKTYAFKILFPNSVIQFEGYTLDHKKKALGIFKQLIMNKTFLLLFVHTLESSQSFSMQDRVTVASFIMVTLQDSMDYCTDILKSLLAELIEKCKKRKSHPKLILRRTESIAEKMLSSWFTFLLYQFLRERGGKPLYLLFCAIKQQLDKGPVDVIKNVAKNSLNERNLLRHSTNFKPMTVYVSIEGYKNIGVKVLDCDTITQVKEKLLDTIYRTTPYSQRPRKDDLDVEWRVGNAGRLILHDYDITNKIEGDTKKLNTLNHYRVPDGSYLKLVSYQYNSSISNEKMHDNPKEMVLNTSKIRIDGSVWHLINDHEDSDEKGERSNEMMPEIYLTRLLATKGTLQQFVDDLFQTIFNSTDQPKAVKYMFAFLDEQARHHGITDPEVVHTWKSNALPLRFWVNLIKNPNFLFDIYKSEIVDSCLSVVAQTLMDSCSKSDHKLGKDSPSSKLLYAKDIPKYKSWAELYYLDIKNIPEISDQDMNTMLVEESRLRSSVFNTNYALHELYKYAYKYNKQLCMMLEEDEVSQRQGLASKLNLVHQMTQDTVNIIKVGTH